MGNVIGTSRSRVDNFSSWDITYGPSDLPEIRAIASEIDAKIKRFAIQKSKLEEES